MRANASKPSQSEIVRFICFSLGAARTRNLASSKKSYYCQFIHRRSSKAVSGKRALPPKAPVPRDLP
jgi:hypothetical protein